MHARPALVCRDAALMRSVGCTAQPVRYGVGQRGAAKRQGPRTAGPLGPEPLAQQLVPLHRRDLVAGCHGTRRALARAGGFGATGTGRVEATALEPTATDAGCGQGPRTRQRTDTHGHGRELEVTV